MGSAPWLDCKYFRLTGVSCSVRVNAHIYKGLSEVTHPCVVAATKTINALRAAKVTGAFDPAAHLSPQVYFSADFSQGGVEITLPPLPDGLLKAVISVAGQPEWLALNIGLGTGSFRAGDTLGIVADLRGTDAFRIQPFIRSDCDGTQCDTTLVEDFTVGGDRGISTLLHPITAEDPITCGTAFHTLILPLPKRDIAVELYDLRLFHIDAATGLRARAVTLGGLAV